MALELPFLGELSLQSRAKLQKAIQTCWFSLNSSELWHFAAFSNILLETFMPNIVA